jgi:hypothetical protein
MADLVTDLPIWEDNPFKVPSHIEVRRGATAERGDTIVFWDPIKQKNASMSADPNFLSQSNVDLAIDLLERI